MTLFIISVALVIIVSGLCSLTEAAIYAVRLPYIRHLAETGSTAGLLLTRFKANMEKPITAILIVNTVANTGGAAIAGAQAEILFGKSWVIVFSILFTLGVLFFAEIMPKVAGVVYHRPVARAFAAPLNFVIVTLYPLVWLTQGATRRLQRSTPEPMAPEEEVRQFAALSAEEGSILPVEAELVENVLQLNDVTARQIMTPRTVVFKKPAGLKVKDVRDEVASWPHARVPIFSEDGREVWSGIVLKNDVLAALAKDQFEVKLESLAKPIEFVPDMIPGHKLLSEFLKRRRHMLGVVDEYGDMAGIVTLEDVIETLIGAEIVDETDVVVDMQEAARRHRRKRSQKRSQ